LPTPKARDSIAEGYEAGLRRSQPQVGTIAKAIADGDDRINLPTPATRDHKDGTAEHRRDGVVQTDTVARAVMNGGEILLRTPAASEAERGHQPEDKARARGGQVTLSGQFLGTPRTSSANAPTSKQMNNGATKARLEDQAVGSVVGNIDWGKFEPAIRRWESVLGREAPNPTKPDGKDGSHRLSSRFTEWMMGLPDGWITDVGLSRTDELKACGNGVVVQQAELALSVLLGDEFDPEQDQISMLPTPTPSDSYIGNLKSEQTKDGSMHSVNLPKAIKMVTE